MVEKLPPLLFLPSRKMYIWSHKPLTMKLLLSVILSSALLFSVRTEAQIIERSTDRAEQKANNRVDRKIDDGIDRSLDAIEGLFKRKDKKNKSSNEGTSSSGENQEGGSDGEMTEEESVQWMMSAFGGGSSIELPPDYAFDHNVEMDMIQYKKNGKEDGRQNMRMHFSDKRAIIGVEVLMEGAAATSIIDMETLQMVVLSDMGSTKMAMVLDMNAAMLQTEQEDMENYENPTFTKTGRTKKILGYHCEEYVVEEDGERTEFWITRDEFLDIYRAFTAMEVTKQGATKTNPMAAHPGGMTMEMTSTDKGGEKTVMQVTAVNRGQGKVVKTAGYQTMRMPGGGR